MADAAPALPAPTASESPPLSRARVVTDLVFGVAAPLGCFLADPIVFHGRPSEFFDYALVAYSAAGLGMTALPLWLLFRRPAGLFAGLLAGGAVFAACMGLALLPLSIIGLAFGIGVLGFTPFATAWVFARNARRAWGASGGWRRNEAPLLAGIGFLLACAGPWAGHWYVHNEMDSAIVVMASDDPAGAERAAGRLKLLGSFTPAQNCHRLVIAYRLETDERRRTAIAKAYNQLTGEDIERRLEALAD